MASAVGVTYGDDQRIERLERAVFTLAESFARVAKDRGIVATMTDLSVRFAPPDTVAKREAQDWSHDEPGPA
jgi:hypothetical protein